jgi:hypothetical protein
MFGKPLVREIPVSEADVQKYMTTAQGASSPEHFKNFLRRYRNSQTRA